MIVVLMGVAGVGKTTVGTALASALGWKFIDADDLHPAANREKIRSGGSLTDDDREPWLVRVHETMTTLAREQEHAVVACSALKERYRGILGKGVPDLRWVFLQARPSILSARLRAREGHFAGPEILDSQLRELEPPHHVLTVRADLPVSTLVDQICTALAIGPPGSANSAQ